MKKTISCIAFDLDGTLLRSDGKVSEATRSLISLLQKKGCLCTIATGRMFQSAAAVAREISLFRVPLIAYNGSLLRVLGEKSSLFSWGIPKELAGELLRFCKKNNWYVQSYLEDRLLVEEKRYWTEYYENLASVQAHALGETFFSPSGDPLKILLAAENEEEHALMIRSLTERFGDTIFLAGSHTPEARFLEVVAQGVNKGKALEKLCEHQGISLEETLVFGDSENDVPLFESAAVSVAMGNAAPHVRNRATYGTESNDQEGIALFFEKHGEQFSFEPSGISRSA